MALAGIWTPAAEFGFHIEYHYTTDRFDLIFRLFFCFQKFEQWLSFLSLTSFSFTFSEVKIFLVVEIINFQMVFPLMNNLQLVYNGL